MGLDLETPFTGGSPVWESLYRAREDEVSGLRPLFTGDVFDQVPVPGRNGESRKRSVLVIQHPCSMRTNGVDLTPRLLVAEIENRRLLSEEEWRGNYSLIPLADLRPSIQTNRRNQAGNFEKLHVVDSEMLKERAACLSPFGINLLMQRWVHFTSRVVVPTFQLQSVIEGEYEESDLLEDWCLERESDPNVAMKECVDWLRDGNQHPTRQERLRDPQQRANIRAEMRQHLRELRRS